MTTVDLVRFPKSVFKYLPAARLKECQKNGDVLLRATQPSDLDDLTEAFSNLLFEVTPEPLADHLSGINPNSPVVDGDYVDQHRDSFGAIDYNKLIQSELSSVFGIVSFASCPDNPTMWARYAGAGDGFVIEFDANQVHQLLGRLRLVVYGKEPPPRADYFSEVEYWERLMSHKSVQWADLGEEWRLIVKLSETIKTDKVHKGWPIHQVRVPSSAVKGVHYIDSSNPDVKRLEKYYRLTKLEFIPGTFSLQ